EPLEIRITQQRPARLPILDTQLGSQSLHRYRIRPQHVIRVRQLDRNFPNLTHHTTTPRHQPPAFRYALHRASAARLALDDTAATTEPVPSPSSGRSSADSSRCRTTAC